ncbi:hypothetical protein C2845_PM07G01610 [Panicum miliaceum]|uniref:Uncharacterized protein n=1 Tax=Panicum miliaceum TaxID=4540 RepID=A0A3L6ST71_PANMI|nr:hypothetical protein C2845_PM07G01610 [Panicum miliaceum]
MASPAVAKGRAGAAAGVTEEAKAEWWLRFNNGVPADDADAADSGDEAEGARLEGAGGKAGMAVSGRSTARVAAAGDEEEAEMGSGDGRAAAVARGAKAELVARGGGMAEAGAGGKRRGSLIAPTSMLPRRKRKAIAKRSKLKGDGVEVQNDMSQVQSPCPVLKAHEQVSGDIENLRLQLAQKTSELKQEENRRLKLRVASEGEGDGVPAEGE